MEWNHEIKKLHVIHYPNKSYRDFVFELVKHCFYEEPIDTIDIERYLQSNLPLKKKFDVLRFRIKDSLTFELNVLDHYYNN